MKILYETNITLFNSFFDKNDNITIKSILSIFQDVASIHAEQIGLGYNDMLQKNLYWVLSRVKFDILKMPMPNEQVVVKTWPHQKGKIDFDRDMQILDLSGNILIKATSKWCVIDTVTRRLMRTDNIEYNGEIIPLKNYEDKFNKIDLPLEIFTECFSYKVMFSDLDHNKHMNNTNYANLVVNALKNKNVKSFEVNFLNECKLDDTIKVYHLKQSLTEYVYGVVNQKTVFTAKIC